MVVRRRQYNDDDDDDDDDNAIFKSQTVAVDAGVSTCYINIVTMNDD